MNPAKEAFCRKCGHELNSNNAAGVCSSRYRCDFIIKNRAARDAKIAEGLKWMLVIAENVRHGDSPYPAIANICFKARELLQAMERKDGMDADGNKS